MANRGERHLSLNEVKYFERAMETYQEIKDTSAVNDFFKPIDDELKGKEVLVAQHKFCSRFLDDYIKECPVASLEKLFRAFSSHFEELSKDKFASHSVENLVKQAAQLVNTSGTSFNEMLASFVTELSSCAAALADDQSGSHVIRCIFTTLSTLPNLVTRIDKLARKVIVAFVSNPGKVKAIHFSLTVQEIAALDPERYGKLLRYLLASVPCTIDEVCDRSSSKLIETLIVHMGTTAITAVYDQTIKTMASECAFHDIGNYVLQKWLENCKDNEQLLIVCEQLIPKVEILINRKPQVIVALSKGLIRTNHILQKKFYDVLVKLSRHDKSVIDYCINIKPPPNGSKILQSVCNFEKAANLELVEAMKKLGGEKVSDIALDLGGSYFVSDFIKSDTIEIKDRFKIVRRLMSKVGVLSSDKNGRFVVEASFSVSDMTLKCQIAQAVVDKTVKERAKTVWKNLRIDHFLSRREQWEKDTENMMKRHDAMDDIINDESIPDVKPLAPKISEPTPEMQAAEEELDGVVGVLSKKKRRHHSQPQTEE